MADSHPCNDALFERQAQVYGDILEACLNNTGCTGFETWGFVRADVNNVCVVLLEVPNGMALFVVCRLIFTHGWGPGRDPFPSM